MTWHNSQSVLLTLIGTGCVATTRGAGLTARRFKVDFRMRSLLSRSVAHVAGRGPMSKVTQQRLVAGRNDNAGFWCRLIHNACTHASSDPLSGPLVATK